MKHRMGLPEQEREARSQLHRLLQQADGLAHGSLIRMARRCGNPKCRCTLKDQKHVSWYLGVTEKGKTRMKHIPKGQEASVRRWVESYQQARGLLDQISLAAWQRLQGTKA